jgi:hypothetical protein
MSYKTGEYAQDRALDLAKTVLTTNATLASASKATDAAASKSVGGWLEKAFTFAVDYYTTPEKP